MVARGGTFLVISTLFVVTTRSVASNAQVIETTLRKSDLMKSLKHLKDDDKVSLDLVSGALQPKEVDPSPPAQPAQKVHEHILKDPYKPKNSTSLASQPNVEKELSSNESGDKVINEPEASQMDSASVSPKETKLDLKPATHFEKEIKSANTKVKQLLDRGPEYVLAFVVISFAICILIVIILRIFGSLIFQCVQYIGAVIGYACALVWTCFDTESPRVDRMRKNIPALPAPEWAWLPSYAERNAPANSSLVMAGSSVPFLEKNGKEVASKSDFMTNTELKGMELKAKMASLQAALDSI